MANIKYYLELAVVELSNIVRHTFTVTSKKFLVNAQLPEAR